MKTNYFVKGQCDIELGNSFNLGAEIFNLVKNNQISQEDLGYYFAGIKDYIKQKVSHRNMQIRNNKLLLCKIYQAIVNKHYELAENLSCSKEAKEYINR